MALLFLLALGLRLWFVAAAKVEDALRRSDTLDYLQYALNLVFNHVFSRSHPGDGAVVADSFRDPGYPAFLAALLLPLDLTDTWYAAVLCFQAVFGALTAVLAALVARRWLPAAWSLAAGVLVAIWPHNVVFTAYVLSETLFGFTLMLAVWLFCRATESGTRGAWLSAGLGFGAAAMVNAVLLPVAPLLALVLWRGRQLSVALAATFLAGALILPAAWAVRGCLIPSARAPEARIGINFVQGSWPEYHSAYIGALKHDPAALALMQSIGREQDLMLESPARAALSIWGRLRGDPWRYLGWYAWKPALLWAWHIRMGWGDVYAYPVHNSIYLTNPVMPAVEALCLALNPLLGALMACAGLSALLRRGRRSPGLDAIALLVALETLLYTILQSEPRYSIPFRALEMILAMTALDGLLVWWRSRSKGGGSGTRAENGAEQAVHSETAAIRGVI
ncbi:MAG TPA: glycosyltransferase family 39 protein [Nevskia sp.]|nr:glycosyltransferase family 39 protein [Nevskia sp.]